MVNCGRSRGCMTCRQRRVKCDEAKPECRACQRLGLPCGGYSTSNYTKLKFKDQTYKFRTNTNNQNGINSHRRAVSSAASSPAVSSISSTSSRSPESPESDVHDDDRQPATTTTALTRLRLSEPDTAVSFYLSHYASMGRDMGSTRGFFEMLIPAYSSQPQDSPLSLAVSALATEVFSMWRHDATSFRSPRKPYARAIARVRAATQDPVERSRPATVLAVLALQTYENVSAIYDLRVASSAHHNGAASLLSLMGTDEMDATVRAYLRRFMLHTEVSTAMRRKRPLKSVAYSWIASDDAFAVPDNPSSALDAIGASVADLQARYTQSVTAHDGGLATSSPEHLLEDWRAEATRLDAELQVWAATVPDHWRPVRLISGRDVPSSIPTYQSTSDVYASCQIASIWNLWRFQRLLLAEITLGSLQASYSGPGCYGVTSGQLLVDSDPDEVIRCRRTLQEMVDGVCHSVPFYLGNRATRSSLRDFTDPAVLLPSCDSWGAGQALDAAMSGDNHKRHVIAQGPWRAMHPLSCLVSHFSEDRGRVMTGLLRPGQREWIRDQFLRLATVLHLPLDAGSGTQRSGLTTAPSPDDKAECLASGIRKGAIFMSGP